MTTPLLSKKKADALSNGAFLIGLGALFYTNTWWPGILIVLWTFLSIRQYFTGRYYDFVISSTILSGLFLIAIFKFSWDVLMPILFVIGGTYIILREYLFSEETSGD